MSPMDHDTARTLLNDHLDGELSPGAEQELAAHLSGCEACQRELADLRRTLSSLAGLGAVAPPQEFVSKVKQRIRRRSRGRFFGPQRLLTRIPFEWVSFVLILIMLLLYLSFIQTSPRARITPPHEPGGSAPVEAPASQAGPGAPQAGPPGGAR